MKEFIIKGRELEEALKRTYRSFKNQENLMIDDLELPHIIKSEIKRVLELLVKSEINESREGKLIVITGVDKSGKETHAFNPYHIKNILSVKEFLERKGYKVLGVRQPSYETVLGKLVGAYLKRAETEYVIEGKIDTNYAWILWSLDRAQHIERVREWLKGGRDYLVLSKRWTESNVIYQYFNGVPVNEILEFEKNIPKADYLIVIDIPYEELMKRLNITRKDSYEKIEYLKKVRGAYLELSKFYPYGEVFLVGGGGKIEETNEHIISCISEIINRFESPQ